MSQHSTAFILDGRAVTHAVAAGTTLAELLGQPIGCGEGVCGSCTLLVDGQPVRSCLMLAVQADGTNVKTVASLAAIEGGEPGALTPLQQAFSTHRTFQCGWCVPGMLVGTAAFLRDNPGATRAERAMHFAGHLCRCVGGARLLDATDALWVEASR